jgi:uncharacterized membrane protein
MNAYRHSTLSTAHTQNRLETLSDGVFAVAMTLLVLDLAVPVISQPLTDAALLRHLIELWPKFLAYFISFLIIGITWVNHEFIFRFMSHINSRLIWLNIIMLMIVALLPFTTSLAGEYWQSQTAVILWGTNGMVTIALVIILWLYARRKNLLCIGISSQNVKIRRIVDILTVALLLVAIGSSFFLPILAMLVYGVLVVFHVIATALGLHEYKSKIDG